MTSQSDYRTAIVLQGGGALGAYEYGVLKALYEKRPHFAPAVVTGVSIGAITGAVLVGARSDPITALRELWETDFAIFGCLPPLARDWSNAFIPEASKQAAALFENHGMYSIRPEYLASPVATDSIYETRLLRKTLEKLVDLEILNRSETHLIVAAIDVESGQSKTFDNRTGLSYEQIIASASLPPSFPKKKIGDHYYWDGGLFSNTPLSEAINALERCNEGDRDISRELLVVELFSMCGTVPGDMPSVLNRLSQLLFASKLNLDKDLFAKLNSFIDLAEKIDQVIPADCPEIRKHPGYEELVNHRKIDAFNIIRSRITMERGNPGDFSKASIDWRIEAGYKDAIGQGIAEPKPVDMLYAQLAADENR
jgi:NTE family protein